MRHTKEQKNIKFNGFEGILRDLLFSFGSTQANET